MLFITLYLVIWSNVVIIVTLGLRSDVVKYRDITAPMRRPLHCQFYEHFVKRPVHSQLN